MQFRSARVAIASNPNGWRCSYPASELILQGGSTCPIFRINTYMEDYVDLLNDAANLNGSLTMRQTVLLMHVKKVTGSSSVATNYKKTKSDAPPFHFILKWISVATCKPISTISK